MAVGPHAPSRQSLSVPSALAGSTNQPVRAQIQPVALNQAFAKEVAGEFSRPGARPRSLMRSCSLKLAVLAKTDGDDGMQLNLVWRGASLPVRKVEEAYASNRHRRARCGPVEIAFRPRKFCVQRSPSLLNHVQERTSVYARGRWYLGDHRAAAGLKDNVIVAVGALPAKLLQGDVREQVGGLLDIVRPVVRGQNLWIRKAAKRLKVAFRARSQVD